MSDEPDRSHAPTPAERAAEEIETAPDPGNPLRPFRAGGAIWILLAFLVGQGIGAVVALMIYVGVAPDVTTTGDLTEASMPYVMIGAFFASALLTYIVADLLIRRRGGESFAEAIDWSAGSRRARILGGLAGVALAGVYVVATVVFPPDPDMEGGPLSQMAGQGGIALAAWTLLALGAPALEEFLFRGVLFTGIKRSWDGAIAGTLTAALFVLAHVAEVQQYAPAFAAITALAIMTQVARRLSGSLGPAIAIHLAYNGSLVAVAWSGT